MMVYNLHLRIYSKQLCTPCVRTPLLEFYIALENVVTFFNLPEYNTNTRKKSCVQGRIQKYDLGGGREVVGSRSLSFS